MIAQAPHTMRLLVLRLLVLGAAALAVFLLLVPVGSAGEPPAPTTAYVVHSGDTLWEIATAHGPATDDVRAVVRQIIEINGIADALIHPGQVIQLPAR